MMLPIRTAREKPIDFSNGDPENTLFLAIANRLARIANRIQDI
jgi:hypothetical protein